MSGEPPPSNLRGDASAAIDPDVTLPAPVAVPGAAGAALAWVQDGWNGLDPRRQMLVGFAFFGVGSTILIALNGLILAPDLVFIWILIGLLAVSIGDVRGWARGVVFDWMPFFGLLLAYGVLRGAVGAAPLFEPHVLPQIRVDELLFGGSIPSVELQERFYDPGQIHAWDIAAWGVYLTHFFVVVVVAAVLWRLARPQFLRFRAMVLTLTAAAFATYVLFPAAPPWMASESGVIGPVERVVRDVWRSIGADRAAAIWDRGSAFANEVAALPSLHTAYPVLILCFFWSRGWWARAICLAYAVGMSITLVYTGEHYVSDVLLGWAYAIATYAAVSRFLAWRSRPARERGAETSAEQPAAPIRVA